VTDTDLPRLFTGYASVGSDPLALACTAALEGTEAGLVIHDLSPDRLRAAVVFAPEVTLAQAAIMLPLCGLGFQNALGVLAPPVVAIHLGWDGVIYVNGGRCGQLTMVASTRDTAAVPDWLVIGLDLDLIPQDEDGGAAPDRTALYAEGCGDVTAPELLAAWLRHTLSWLDTWDNQGVASLHREWSGLVHGLKKTVTLAGQTGTFLGADEHLNAILKTGETTDLIPLTRLLKDAP
jgi:BirA family biotin operon repressor/biotin-[acetyl-CoA-carboxylase] ligase